MVTTGIKGYKYKGINTSIANHGTALGPNAGCPAHRVWLHRYLRRCKYSFAHKEVRGSLLIEGVREAVGPLLVLLWESHHT